MVFQCKDLSKTYGRTQALEGVNLSIAPGRIVGLLGPNGSGKTTLIKLANGLLTPSGGSLSVCGEAVAVLITRNTPGQIARVLVGATKMIT